VDKKIVGEIKELKTKERAKRRFKRVKGTFY
jgi:hypothetical protein